MARVPSLSLCCTSIRRYRKYVSGERRRKEQTRDLLPRDVATAVPTCRRLRQEQIEEKTDETTNQPKSDGSNNDANRRQELNDLITRSRTNDALVVEDVRRLVQRFPSLCVPIYRRRHHPLHHAVSCMAPLAILQLLISAYPRAQTVRGIDGYTPLSVTCRSGCHASDAILLLVTPEAVRMGAGRDGGGGGGEDNEDSPLNMYCFHYERNLDMDVLQALVYATRAAQVSHCLVDDVRGTLLAAPFRTVCCLKRAPVTENVMVVLRYFLNVDSQAIQQVNCYGQTLLHEALRGEEEFQLIEFLVESYPSSLTIHDDNGETPVHAACNTVDSEELMQFFQLVATVCPQSLSTLDKSNRRTPLHTLCKYAIEGDLPAVELLVASCPESLCALDGDGCTPLHLCYFNDACLPTIQLLAETRPETLMMKNKAGLTPLHLACGVQPFPCLHVIRFLARKCPAVLEPVGVDGSSASTPPRHPLHLLCDNAFALDCLSELAISEAVVNVKDCTTGQTPLHVLCQKGARPEHLQILVDQCPSLLRSCDDQGHTPLHAAIEKSTDNCTGSDMSRYDTTIEWLLDAYPAATHVKDNHGMTPLELACEKNADVNIIYRIVCVNPIAILGFGHG